MATANKTASTEVVVVDAVRSAVGRAQKGALRYKRPDELAGDVVRALLARNPKVPTAEVEDLVLGCAMPEGEQGLNVARLSGLLGGLAVESGGQTINRFCSSGLQSIATAAGAIAFGSAEVLVAGGVESMSMVPMTGFHLSASPEIMERIPTAHTPMGITAENLAKRYGIARADADALAYGSQMKAKAAMAAGRFKDEIVAVDAIGYGAGGRETTRFEVDELPRPDTTLEGLAALKPSFAVDGQVTPGNASPLSDGAAAALVMTKAKADAFGVKPLAYFRGFVTVGVDPSVMGIGPVPAVKKLLAKSGLSIDQIDLFEMNEAFACQALYCQRALEIPDAKLNVNGGAIALGHPLGCTGAKLTATALHELKRRQGRYAIVTMCIGGGQGAAGLFERVA